MTIKVNNILNYSYWEIQRYFKNIDLVIVGSGIVGLSTAISFKEKNKKAKVIILERGVFPTGASTKNAGFACFGSVSELISDIKNTNKELVFETIEMRIKGLAILRNRLGDKQIDFKKHGGYELFDDSSNFEKCCNYVDDFNMELQILTNQKHTYSITTKKVKSFGFKNITGIIKNIEEGQIDTGKMMANLIKLANEVGIIILNCVHVESFSDIKTEVVLNTNLGELKTRKVIVATNGFANELLNLKDVKSARAQVLITEPLKNLKIKGTFHYNEGYVYFRNIHNRILLGGGRNLDFETESSSLFTINNKIQNYLDDFLKKVIVPNQNVKIEQRWTGIMGIGNEKKPIIKSVSKNVVCAVRMGGMGVAIGSMVGKLAALKIEE